MRLFLLAILILLALTNCITIRHLEGEVVDADATSDDAGDDTTDDAGDDTTDDAGDDTTDDAADDGFIAIGGDTANPNSLPDLPDGKDLSREELEQFYSMIVGSMKSGPPAQVLEDEESESVDASA
jgi:hypothetical protein